MEVKAADEAIEKLKECAKEMIGTVDGKAMEVLRASLVCPLHLPSILIFYTDSYTVLPRCVGQWSTPRMSRPRYETRKWN